MNQTFLTKSFDGKTADKLFGKCYMECTAALMKRVLMGYTPKNGEVANDVERCNRECKERERK